MDGVTTYDAIADAFGFGEIKNYDWFTLGKVTAVDGTKLKVLLGGSAVPADCESYCYAQVGDVVLVVVMKGIARAVAVKGGGDYLPLSGGTLTGDLTVEGDVTFEGDASITEQASWRNALGLGSMATETASDYLKRKPSGTSELPQDTATGSGYPLVLSDSFANNGEISYMSAANFRTLIGTSYSNAVSLYDNSSGTTGTVTLSQTAANFSILEIFFCDIDGNYSSVRVWSPNGKVVSLTTSAVVGTSLFFISWTRRVKINGTSIANQAVSNYSTGRFYIYSNGTTGVQSDNYIKIVKVLGWKG